VKALSRLIVKLADLLEAEGRALRSGAVNIGLAAAIAFAGAIVGVAGIGLLSWAVFALLRRVLGPPGAAAICGLALLACAGVLLWIVRKMSR
jgi:hypothetical protein